MSTNSRSAETPRPLRTRLHAGHLALALIAAVPSCSGDDGSAPATWSLGAETLTAMANEANPGGTIVQRCPDGSLGVGYEGSQRGTIDEVRLLCAELRPDGTLGRLATTSPIGVRINGVAFSIECAPDSLALTVLVGDRGHYDPEFIFRIQGQCLRPDDVATGVANDASVRTTAHAGAGGGGLYYTLFCPHGSAVTGLRGKEAPGGYLAAFGLICRELHDG